MSLTSSPNKIHQTSVQILLLVCFLTLIGIGISFLSGYHISLKFTGNPNAFAYKQIKLLLISLPLMFVLFFFSTKKIFSFSPWLFLTSILLLVLVFVPGIGRTTSGASRWIDLGFTQFQPSEITKIAFILFFSFLLDRKKEKLNEIKFGLFPIFLVLIIPVFLISIEPDFSTAIIFFVLGLIMIYTAGIHHIYFIFSISLFLPFLIYFLQTKKYFLSRFLFFTPELDPYGKGYHIRQSLNSFLKSGWFGMKNHHIINSIRHFPDTHTDFTFSIIARTGGLFGILMIILCFLALFYLCFKLAYQLQNFYERMVVIGVTSLFAIECSLHFLVNIGLIPTTGILLPFLSYGGTALLSHLALMVIVLRICLEHASKRKS